jgi:hypothetical protein
MEEIMDRDEALKTSDEALKELSSALQQGKSEKLLEYLGMMSRFHNYSFGNCILIAMQKPDATLVAGFGKWKEMNRFVKKGEKGIAILAPLVGKKKMDAEPLQPRLRQRMVDSITPGSCCSVAMSISKTRKLASFLVGAGIVATISPSSSR